VAAGAGQTFAVSKAITYWAPLGTAIPDRSVPYNDDANVNLWPTGWNKQLDTVNGVQATFRNPRTAVVSEERGRLGQVASGDEGVTLALQAVSIDMDLLQLVSALEKTSKAATSSVQTLALTAGISTNAAFTITLNGVTYTVSGATTASQGTAANLATYLRTAANYTPSLPTTGATGWTPGGSGSNVTYTAATTGARNGTYAITPGTTGAAGTFTQTTVGADVTDIYHLDKNAPMGFMLGFEGIATAGSLFPTRRWIRGIAYHVESTNNVEHSHRHTGVDAVFRPTMTLEAQPALDSEMTDAIVGTDFLTAELDPNKRFDYFFITAPEA
jgi:hypothetical protein